MLDEKSRHHIELLYGQYFKQLFRYANKTLNNEALAEEVVHDTFRIAVSKADALLEHPQPKAWLLVTLKNVIANLKRKQDAERRLIEDYVHNRSSGYTFSEDRMSFELMYEDIADLEELKLLKEMTYDGLSQKQMADARGITLNALKKRVQRAKETLRNKNTT